MQYFSSYIYVTIEQAQRNNHFTMPHARTDDTQNRIR